MLKLFKNKKYKIMKIIKLYFLLTFKNNYFALKEIEKREGTKQ